MLTGASAIGFSGMLDTAGSAAAELISSAVFCAVSLSLRQALVAAEELLPLVWLPSAREDVPYSCEARRPSARRLSSLARLLPGPAFAGWRARHLRQTVQPISCLPSFRIQTRKQANPLNPGIERAHCHFSTSVKWPRRLKQATDFLRSFCPASCRS